MKYCTMMKTAQMLTIALGENGKLLGETQISLHQAPTVDFKTLLAGLLHGLGSQLTDMDFAGIVKAAYSPEVGESEVGKKLHLLVTELKIPLISVWSLDMLGWAAQDCEKGLAVIQNLAQSLWFKASYQWDSCRQIPVCLEEPHILTTEELRKEVELEDNRILVSGDSLPAAEYLKNKERSLPGYYQWHYGLYSVQAVWHQWLESGPDEEFFPLYKIQEKTKARELSAHGPLIMRMMREEDLKDVMKIELRSFPSPWSPLAFVTELRHNEDAYYFCLYSYGILLGYLGVWLIFDEGYITRLAIHPDFRAKGHGSYLIRQVLEWMKPRGVKRLNLEIRSSNTLACSFYKKLGFLPRATKQAYYTDPPEDAMVMTLDLNCP
ncbi:ribosomal protein S18-alanine N-acetyltransferase [Desulfitobacterium hafniense]|uniref:N-acetyltransferase domain-containing protein n=3 Tax=Desulfitobacterium hafniense TaxID=49338 RepID=Q24XQ5_DESHY|nr:ribosomal protein S18-alanine N-acetyltransferase [Desulfitobacterium hafniense]KTE91451.1 ribosomal-protein-alanine acetyltransferase [Desulfitobacterium hafniense]BAE83187.1 hypothetical protein DSY1398 [Desulfitobacterium hafniense Y51]